MMKHHINIAIQNKGFHDINPILCGYEACRPNHRFGPTIRHFYLIHCILSGQGTFTCPSGSYTLSAGQAFLIEPEEITVYTADSCTPWVYIWIGFDGGYANKLGELSAPVFDAPIGLFRDMLETERLPAMREEYLAGKIFLLLSELFGAQKNENYADVAADFIAANYLQHIKIHDVAKAVGLDQRYLSRLFKAKNGCSMQEYLIRHRMEEALRLLQKGFLVSEAAAMVGYRDPFVFSKAFKHYYGSAPKDFRRR